MSRARPIKLEDGSLLTKEDGTPWYFDMKRGHEKATHDQIELLATIEEADLDDLLDESLTQSDIVRRLREALGTSPIPESVLERRDQWRVARQSQPACRICGKTGDSTKHHFINKWILRELSGYSAKWADRSKNCIPLCIDCHRDIHDRNGENKSIAHLLSDEEKEFAEAAFQALAEERPKLLILIARGDDSVYEARLAKDWIEGRFRTEAPTRIPHLSVVR